MKRWRVRGVLLLEALVSLAILVTLSMAISSVVRDSTERLIGAGERADAQDLARSALAQIEAGIATPEALSGPVPAWNPGLALEELGDEVGPRSSDQIEPGTSGDEPSGWALSIETQPSPYDGLTLVSVTAARENDPRARATLHQLIRLGELRDEGVGDLDEITRQGERRAPDGGRP